MQAGQKGIVLDLDVAATQACRGVIGVVRQGAYVGAGRAGPIRVEDGQYGAFRDAFDAVDSLQHQVDFGMDVGGVDDSQRFARAEGLQAIPFQAQFGGIGAFEAFTQAPGSLGFVDALDLAQTCPEEGCLGDGVVDDDQLAQSLTLVEARMFEPAQGNLVEGLLDVGAGIRVGDHDFAPGHGREGSAHAAFPVVDGAGDGEGFGGSAEQGGEDAGVVRVLAVLVVEGLNDEAGVSAAGFRVVVLPGPGGVVDFGAQSGIEEVELGLELLEGVGEVGAQLAVF